MASGIPVLCMFCFDPKRKEPLLKDPKTGHYYHQLCRELPSILHPATGLILAKPKTFLARKQSKQS